MKPFEFSHGQRVVFGEDLLDQLGGLAGKPGDHVLIVTDPGIEETGIVERAVTTLEKASLIPAVFKDVQENPTTRNVDEGVRFAKEQEKIDLIIGLGGGSAMDCAKGINFVFTNGGRMEDYWGADKASLPMLPSIGIPTTAGTGSEAQSFALIAQEKSRQKMACGDRKARFRTAVLDPSLVRFSPDHVAAASGMDAISHSVESYVSTKRNPFSQMLARESWRLLEGSFEDFLADRSNRKACSQMLLGSHLAGASIENSMLGAAHACANPLTARYEIPHGVAVGMMLPGVIQFNSQAEDPKVDDLYLELQNVRSRDGLSLVDQIRELKAAAVLPERLRELRVREADLPDLAREAAVQWTGKFNPRPVDKSILLGLYEQAY